MPFAANPIDGVRTYYEDEGGSGPSVLFYYGFMDPIPAARALGLARALCQHYRVVFADHRGQGLSDKPHEPASYALPLRVADAVAVLDALGLERAHFAGISWGARLGFALGEHAPDRVRALVLSGNQPYAWDESWPIVHAVSEAIAASRDGGGTTSILRWFEAYAGRRLPRRARQWILENDPDALYAAWTSAMAEGDISNGLARWTTPCLVIAGERDDMHENARRAAEEIPGARFLSLAGHDHLSSIEEVAKVLPEVRRLFDSVPAAFTQ